MPTLAHVARATDPGGLSRRLPRRAKSPVQVACNDDGAEHDEKAKRRCSGCLIRPC